MRILFISESLLTGDLAYHLKNEGNEVKLFIEDSSCSDCYNNLVERVYDWEAELAWVGKDGLIIFEDLGMAESQSRLREEGYAVFGTSKAAEESETSRAFGNTIFNKYGLKTVPLQSFDNIEDAVDFIRQNPAKWVLKYENGCWLKPYASIGEYEDGSDIISTLLNYKELHIQAGQKLTLQQRVEGVEVGIGRYFNGEDWIGPIEYNVEHPYLFPGNRGPVVNEMGTVMWLDDDENEKFYIETLKRISPFLKESKFKGDYSINCIINAEGIFPLEVTARFGAPEIHLQRRLQTSSWSEFLYAIATGSKCEVTWDRAFGVIISVVTPPFPYRVEEIGKAIIGLPMSIKKPFPNNLFEGLHLDEVASRDGTLDSLYLSGSNGYAFYVSGKGATIKLAREEALERLKHVHVPKMFYRDDIGVDFEQKNLIILKSLGFFTKL